MMPVEAQPAVESQPTPSTPAPSTPVNHDDAFAQAVASSQAQPTADANANPTPAIAGQPAQAAVPATPAQQNYRELAAKAGLKTEQFKSDEELFQAMLEERRQMQPLVNVGRQFAPHLSEFEKYLQSQQQAAPAAAAAAPADPNAFDAEKHFSEKWGAPAWDSTWDFFINKGMLTRDEESGLLVPAQGFEAMVAPHIEKINSALEAQSQAHRDLFRGNPYKTIHEALMPAFQHEMKTFFEQQFGARQTQQQQQTEVERFEQQYASVLFTKDTAGNEVVTPAGQKLASYAQKMVERGFSDAEALNMAAEMMGLSAQTPAPAAQPAVPATPVQASGAKVESFIDQARRNATQQPNSAPYAAPTNNPAQPYVTSQVELDGMWSQVAASLPN